MEVKKRCASKVGQKKELGTTFFVSQRLKLMPVIPKSLAGVLRCLSPPEPAQEGKAISFHDDSAVLLGEQTPKREKDAE